MVRAATPSMQNVGTTVAGSSVTVSPLGKVMQAIGREDEERTAVLMGTAGLLVLSPTMFRVIQLGGFREKPKRVLLDSPLDGLTVGWADADGGHATRFRCWVIDLPDGRLMTDSTCIERKGERTPYADHADEFVAALGAHARALDIG